MPRVDADTIRISIQRTGEDHAERYDVGADDSIRDILTNELGCNPKKFTISVNGKVVDDLDETLSNGDKIKLEPLNYSSGR